MADEQTPANGATPVNGTVQSTSDEVAAPSKQDWAGWAKASRRAVEGLDSVEKRLVELSGRFDQVVKGLQSPQGAAPQTQVAPATSNNDVSALSAEVQSLKRGLALNQFYAANGISDAKQQEMLGRMLANTPADMVASEASEFLSAFKPAQTVAPQPSQDAVKPSAPPAAPIGKASAQAPAFHMSSSPVVSGNVFSWPKEVVDSMTTADLKKAYEATNKRTRNVWADLKAQAKK